MLSDYKNLNAVEISAVTFVVVSVMFVGITGLSMNQQNNLWSALDILDLHDQISLSVDTMQSVLSLQEEFYNQFYIAFTQLASLPEEPIKIAYLQFLNFSDQIAFDYRLQNTSGHEYYNSQTVAGASIDAPKHPQESQGPPKENIPNSFEPLEWQPIKQELINIWSQ